MVSHLIKFVVRDEFAQRDRYLRENLDATAQKVGEMQAKLIKLEAQGDRVSSLVGVKLEEVKSLLPNSGKLGGLKPSQGGPFVPANTPSFEQLNSVIAGLDERSDQRSDLFTMIESSLFEKRMRSLMVPNGRPIEAAVGSGFGFRSDPLPAVLRCTPAWTLPPKAPPASCRSGWRGAAFGNSCSVWQFGRNRPRTGPADALRAHLQSAGQGRRDRETRSAHCRSGCHRPLHRAAFSFRSDGGRRPPRPSQVLGCR